MTKCIRKDILKDIAVVSDVEKSLEHQCKSSLDVYETDPCWGWKLFTTDSNYTQTHTQTHTVVCCCINHTVLSVCSAINWCKSAPKRRRTEHIWDIWMVQKPLWSRCCSYRLKQTAINLWTQLPSALLSVLVSVCLSVIQRNALLKRSCADAGGLLFLFIKIWSCSPPCNPC